MIKRIISFSLRKIPRKYLQLFSHIVLKVAAVLYKGETVECPVCGSKFKRFMPYGRQARANALCPSCLALERHRLLWLYLKRDTDFFTAERKMLHIAPELCFIPRFKKMENLEYVTADLESPLAEVKMDIHEMPFEDDSFDVIFCNHVLEHVNDDIVAMKEMKRVLRPGGWAILQIPIFEPLIDETIEDPTISDPKERERLFGQDDHVRMYGKDYPKRIESAGFRVDENDFVLRLDKEEVEKYALPKEEIIYRAIKV